MDANNKVYIVRSLFEDDYGDETWVDELWEAPRNMWDRYLEFMRLSADEMGIEIQSRLLVVRPPHVWTPPIAQKRYQEAKDDWNNFKRRHSFRYFLIKHGAKQLDYERVGD